jgi:hypothetical protein
MSMELGPEPKEEEEAMGDVEVMEEEIGVSASDDEEITFSLPECGIDPMVVSPKLSTLEMEGGRWLPASEERTSLPIDNGAVS